MISFDLRGADKVFEHNRDFRRQVLRTIARSLGRGVSRTARGIRQDLQGLGVVRGITRRRWGQDRLNRLSARVKPITLSFRESTNLDAEQEARMAIGLYGYPAVLESGGRTVPHEILVKQHGRPKMIRHPGSNLPGHGFGGSNMRRNAGTIVGDVDREIGELLARIYGV